MYAANCMAEVNGQNITERCCALQGVSSLVVLNTDASHSREDHDLHSSLHLSATGNEAVSMITRWQSVIDSATLSGRSELPAHGPGVRFSTAEARVEALATECSSSRLYIRLYIDGRRIRGSSSELHQKVHSFRCASITNACRCGYDTVART